jgi:HPt (histidine-containing phosphotransfer) domain-containing protein
VSDDLAERLAALKLRFLDRAARESEALETIATDLERGASGAPICGEIRRIAHNLAGGGGTFGFVGISSYAAELEGFVSDNPDSPELADACRTLVGEIRRTT